MIFRLKKKRDNRQIFFSCLYSNPSPNKRPKSHIAHMINISNQQTHLRSYNHSITLIKREKITMLFFLLEFPSPNDVLSQVWLKLAQWFWRRFLNFVKVVSPFRYYLPQEKGVALQLNKLEFPSPKYALCQVWLKSQIAWLRWANVGPTTLNTLGQRWRFTLGQR